MHHLPRFFSHRNKTSSMNPKTGSRPRLERRNAVKHIDYEATSSSSSIDDTSSFLVTRSLDFPDRTSFRVGGKEGEFDRICRSLGLTGPEDFAIPAAAWEAMKVRSASDLLPRSGLHELDGRRIEEVDLVGRVLTDKLTCEQPTESAELNTNLGGIDDTELTHDESPESAACDCTVVGGIERNESPLTKPVAVIDDTCSACESAPTELARDELTESPELNTTVCTVFGRIRVIGSPQLPMIDDTPSTCKIEATELARDESTESSELNTSDCSTVVGIRGTRPPSLKPPPTITLPVIDDTRSTWEIVSDFAPEEIDRGIILTDNRDCRFDYKVDVEEINREDDENLSEVDENVLRIAETVALLSGSCSFTTSNDDDSSSTTTEIMSKISPHGRLRRTINYWEKGELLGRGSFGSVYEGISEDGIFFAVKEVSLLDKGSQGKQSVYQLEQEIALLSQFEHENIVQYYGTKRDESKLYIFLELMTQGSILALYQRYNLRDSQVSAYTRQILLGLKYLHEQNVVHRDIKCANILVAANGSVKLSDFGLAKATKLNDVKSCKGTVFWMAPEVVNQQNQGYGLPADIWSLGCTVLEMLTRQIPYYPLECFAALLRIGRRLPPPLPDSLSSEARDFISLCLRVSPHDRPTAAELLDHSFVKRPLPTSSDSASPHVIRRS